MSIRIYLAVSGCIFFVVGLLHLLRLIYHWPMQLGAWVVPHGLSYFGLVFPWSLSGWAYSLQRRRSDGQR